MCTAAAYKTRDFCFRRTLDYEASYGETVTVTPRNLKLMLRDTGTMDHHFAFIGVAHITENYPLYCDVVNEKGLCIAGLNSAGNAHYREKEEGKDNIAQWEFIPWIMGQCAAVNDAREPLDGINFLAKLFSPHFPMAQLHRITSDKNNSITVEGVEDGIFVCDSPVGVLINNPPFPFQMFNSDDYMRLSIDTPRNYFSEQVRPDAYSRGVGAIGFPGGLSSMLRFVRMAFTGMNSLSENDEESSIGQFFHISGSAEQQRGCCRLVDGKYEISTYTSCCNADRGIYYYRTYDNYSIVGVDMNRGDLNGEVLINYKLITDRTLETQNWQIPVCWEKDKASQRSN